MKKDSLIIGVIASIIVILVLTLSTGIFMKVLGSKSTKSDGPAKTFGELLKRDSNSSSVSLGIEQSVATPSLAYIPDGHISKVEEQGKVRLFVSAHDKTYMMNGENLENMTLFTDSSNNPVPVLQPDGTGIEHDYAGFGSVIKNPKTNQLIGIYHAEQRTNPDASNTQTTAISLALSSDGGLTWDKKGVIIPGIHPLPSGTNVSGAGQPSAIITGDYIYVYYVDWNDQMPVGIHVARSPLVANGLPGSWEYFTGSDFSTTGLSKNVIGPVISDGSSGYVANPSISYNTYLHAYVVIFEKNSGFFMATSSDGLHWNTPERFFKFAKDASLPKQNGDVWYSYPSFISPATASDTQTTQDGYLFYSRGIYGKEHYLVRRSLTLR